MKTNFEKVKAICDSGKIAIVETSDKIYPNFYAIFRIQWLYRYGFGNSEQAALTMLWADVITKEEINDMEIVKIHQPIEMCTHNIQAGDKVRILNCGHIKEWYPLKDVYYEMIGKSFEVKLVD